MWKTVGSNSTTLKSCHNINTSQQMSREVKVNSVGADSGSPVGGGADPPGGATQNFEKLSKKLHEIEKCLERWGPGEPPWTRHWLGSTWPTHSSHDTNFSRLQFIFTEVLWKLVLRRTGGRVYLCLGQKLVLSWFGFRNLGVWVLLRRKTQCTTLNYVSKDRN